MLTHSRLADALTSICPGAAAVVCGIEVRRTPEVGERFAPKGGRFRVNQGEEVLLLRAIDLVMALSRHHAVPGGPPWRDADDDSGPAPSYHGKG
jgi:hypothetical protein